MTTITTLFGGLLAVVLVYLLVGVIRGIPPILRALLAGLIPLIGYFALILGRWPGLDVVAIHISVYLAAGLVLYAVSQFRRRSVGRMHWAPKLLTAFFLGLVVVNASLLYIASNGLPQAISNWWLGKEGVRSGFSGVVPHGQGAAKAVSSELSQAHEESELGWQVDVSGLDQSDLARSVRVRVKDRTGLPIDRLEAQMRLFRPGSTEASLVMPLAVLDVGLYGGELRLPANGRWIAELRLSGEGQVRYQYAQEIVAP